jgi:signal transduction histidine kinase
MVGFEQEEIVIFFGFVSSLVLSVLLIWFFITLHRRKFLYETESKDAKLREQNLIIKNQKAIEYERNRIATEMHDELGSGLTIIQYLSDNIVSRSNDQSINDDITKIARYSTVLVSNMSEIIWAMNSRFDNLDGLIGYLRRYIVEYLEDNRMAFSFLTDGIEPSVSITGEKRRNLYLVVKEILHNSIKYSNATKINILIGFYAELTILITEVNGIGFDPKENMEKGNGLFNVENRMRQIGGRIIYQKEKDQMEVKIVLPLTNDNSVIMNNSKADEK